VSTSTPLARITASVRPSTLQPATSSRARRRIGFGWWLRCRRRGRRPLSSSYHRHRSPTAGAAGFLNLSQSFDLPDERAH
jgi:hypothetical protein